MEDEMGEAARKAVEKLEKYKADPSKFICIDDLIFGIIKTDKGMATYLGEYSRIDFEIALSRLNYKVNEAFRIMDIESAVRARKEKETTGLVSSNGKAL